MEGKSFWNKLKERVISPEFIGDVLKAIVLTGVGIAMNKKFNKNK